MFPANFEYRCPANITEALGLLNEHGENAKLLAGGQSLIPILKLRLAEPQWVVDIGRLAELRGIRETDDSIQIGSLVRHVEIERSELLAHACPLLPETAAEIGDVQVRNRGTFGGSLAHADPAGDFPAAALALEVRLTASSVDGERSFAAEDFFTGLMTTALHSNEILTSIAVPKQGARSGSAYTKLHQQASGFAIVGVASLVTLDAAGNLEDVRVGITGVADRPYRARGVEERLRGRVAGSKEIHEAAALAADGVEMLGDIHASEAYRRDLAAVFTARSLQKAVERVRG